MMPNHSKEELIRSLSGNTVDGYKRKKLKNVPEVEPEKVSEAITEVEMDLEDSERKFFSKKSN